MLEVEANCRYENLPCSIKAFCVECPDGTFTIILNSRYDHETLMNAFWHEIQHIKNRDFEKEIDVSELEQIAHGRRLKT